MPVDIFHLQVDKEEVTGIFLPVDIKNVNNES